MGRKFQAEYFLQQITWLCTVKNLARKLCTTQTNRRAGGYKNVLQKDLLEILFIFQENKNILLPVVMLLFKFCLTVKES